MSDGPVLHAYTIYARPSDLPHCPFVVREFAITGGAAQPGRLIGVAQTLHEARDLLPPTADACFTRNVGDLPTVVETWM